MTFRLKVERGQRVSYANIRKEPLQAEGNSSWKELETQACLQYLKTNKQNQYMEASVAGADGMEREEGDEVREEAGEIT